MQMICAKLGPIGNTNGRLWLCRVSTIGQTLAAQESALHEAGAAKVFKERVSGAANHRAQLHRLLKTISTRETL